MIDFLFRPWPWFIAGPMIGLVVPLLLLLGNKNLGVSSTLRQFCAACIPAGIPSLQYDWKKDSWNILFVAGILIGGFLGGKILTNKEPVALAQSTIDYLHAEGVNDLSGLMPSEIFNWKSLMTLKGFFFIVVGGFMVGFGTRYAKGCTSGHGILGLSALQWPSLAATACFFLGGILVSRFILPLLFAL